MTPADRQRLRDLIAKAPKLPDCPPRSLDGVITCPMCDGAGDVEVITSDTVSRGRGTNDVNVAGFQCFGIGEDHLILEQLARQAIRNLPALLDRADAADRMEAELKEMADDLLDAKNRLTGIGAQRDDWKARADKAEAEVERLRLQSEIDRRKIAEWRLAALTLAELGEEATKVPCGDVAGAKARVDKALALALGEATP